MSTPASRKRRPEPKINVTKADQLEDILSGKISEKTTRKKKGKTRQRAVELLPSQLRQIADVLAAGRVIKKEIDTKISLSEQRVREYCVRRFCERFAATGRRPSSTIYAGSKSRFTFIQTQKIHLTPEKADALRMMNIPIDDYTELTGVDIDYAVIKANNLEFKLKTALSQMDVPEKVLNEIFQPKVELKESFFNTLNTIIKETLQEGEDLIAKMYDAVSVLGPINQLKNPEVHGLSLKDSFKLVDESDIPAPGEGSDAA